MNNFQNNIISIFGESGKKWLKDLPQIVSKIALKYNLSELKEATNLSYNYVMSGIQNNQEPIILKLGLDIAALKRESEALKIFGNYGAVKLLAQEDGLMILQHAIPGTSLKTYSATKEIKVNIGCHVMQRLHQVKAPKSHNFPHIRDWLVTFDKEWDMPRHYLIKAQKLRDKLLQNTESEKLLHGDLHYDNILNHKQEWLVIDPKGVIGPPISETWAFVMNISEDTKFIANFFGFNLQEVIDWYFTHLILATCWNLEDNLDASLFMELANQAYNMTSE